MFHLLLILLPIFIMAFSDCGDNRLITPMSVVLDPVQPVIGQNINIYIYGTSHENVTDGNVDVSIKLNSIPLYTTTLPLCQLTTCPLIENQDFKITYSVDIPGYAPSGNYNITLNIVDQNKVDSACINMETHLSTSTFEKVEQNNF